MNASGRPASLPPAALSVIEAARYLSIGRTRMFALLKSGEVPAVRVGGRTLVRVVDLDAFLESHVTRAA